MNTEKWFGIRKEWNHVNKMLRKGVTKEMKVQKYGLLLIFTIMTIVTTLSILNVTVFAKNSERKMDLLRMDQGIQNDVRPSLYIDKGFIRTASISMDRGIVTEEPGQKESCNV